jgi:hypothetical protein
VPLLEAYFDETGTHDGSPIFAIAGYVYETEAARRLDICWKGALDDFELPYFRMSACAHGHPPFDKLSRSERIDAATRMIDLVRVHMTFGVAISVNEQDFHSWAPANRPFDSAYTFCCWIAINAIRQLNGNNGFSGDIAYFFEAGCQDQGNLDAFMKNIARDQRLKEHYYYAGHSFVPKEKVRPVQSADILVWHHANQFKRWENSERLENKLRKDFKALVSEGSYKALNVRRHMLESLINGFKEIHGPTSPASMRRRP